MREPALASRHLWSLLSPEALNPSSHLDFGSCMGFLSGTCGAAWGIATQGVQVLGQRESPWFLSVAFSHTICGFGVGSQAPGKRVHQSDVWSGRPAGCLTLFFSEPVSQQERGTTMSAETTWGMCDAAGRFPHICQAPEAPPSL